MTDIYGYTSQGVFQRLVVGNPQYVLPIADSTVANYVLSSDAKGNVTWVSPGSVSDPLTNLTVTGTTNLQGAVTCGSSLSVAGLLNCGTFAITSGNITCSSITCSGTISNGTNAATVGSLSVTSLLSSGTVSSGTNAATFGNLSVSSVTSSGNVNGNNGIFTLGINTGNISCIAITATGTISCGTNAATVGALSVTSLLSSGTVSSGTNAATFGALSVTSLTSTGFITAGTNSIAGGIFTIGSINSTNSTISFNTSGISVSSITNNGVYNSGTNAINCGAITAVSSITCGTNAATVGNLTSTSLTCNGTLSCGTFSATLGAVSITSLTSTGTISCGTNGMTCGTLYSNVISCGTNSLSVTQQTISTPQNNASFIIDSGINPTVGNFMNMYILKRNNSGQGTSGNNLNIGVNANVSSGQIPSEAVFILNEGSTYPGICLGRGGSTSSWTKDIYIDGSGNVSMTNGSVTVTSLTSNGTISCGTNAATFGALSITSLTSTGTISSGTNAATFGAVSVTSLTSTGTISNGTNAATIGSMSLGTLSSTTYALNVFGSGSTTDGGNLALFEGSTTATLSSGITIYKNNNDALRLGVAGTTVNGDIISGSCYITTFNNNNTLSIGRGNNSNYAYNSDILVGTDGAISHKNQPYGLFYNVATSSQTASTNTTTQINFWKTTADESTGTAYTCNGTSVTIPTAGIYAVKFYMQFPSDILGYRAFWIQRNSTVLAQVSLPTNSASVAWKKITTADIKCAANDSISFYWQHGSTNTLTIGNASQYIYFSILKLT